MSIVVHINFENTSSSATVSGENNYMIHLSNYSNINGGVGNHINNSFDEMITGGKCNNISNGVIFEGCQDKIKYFKISVQLVEIRLIYLK